MLAGVSVDYYVRMERGSLAGVSESVLASLADALRLDDAERDHLEALARESGASSTRAASNRRACLLYTSPSPRDRTRSRMPSSA